MTTMAIAVLAVALVFDFRTGLHDTANAMATSIATGALRPRVAVVLASVLNLVSAFLSVQVALTVFSGLVDEAGITPAMIFGGLVGAIIWNLLTWLLALPSSSSHALFGGVDRGDMGVRRLGCDQAFERGGQVRAGNDTALRPVPVAA